MQSVIKDEYAIYNADCVEFARTLPENSIGLSVFSPPFPGMYAYTDSERDMGNCANIEQMMGHFQYLIPALYMATMPGRSCAIHLTQEPIFAFQEGYSGLRDFRGDMIRAMQAEGWVLRSERMIDKCPILKAARTKDAGLAMKSGAQDSARWTGTMPDYLLQFTKRGDNPVPIRALIDHPSRKDLCNPDGWITAEEWKWWASAVWWNKKRHTPDGGISETDVLRNFTEGKDEDDEKHLCPLQLGVIERCIKLWSAPGDTVYSPFLGIGSEGYMALKLRRRFIGTELKPSYFNVAARNLEDVIRVRDSDDGFLPFVADEEPDDDSSME
jgi:DNA modification methylase